MKRTLLFMACLLASITMQAQEELNDYLPFVERNKAWFVANPSNTPYYLHNYYWMNDEEEHDGKTYLKLWQSEAVLTVMDVVGLIREENRKVYFFDSDQQKEYLMFDYSLQAGDTYETYSYDDQKMVSYKVLSVDDCTEEPEALIIVYDQPTHQMITLHRSLRKWVVCRTDDTSLQKIWIEGIGSLDGPLGHLRDVIAPGSSQEYLAYVLYHDNDWNYYYMPCSFNDTSGVIRGCNLPTGERYYNSATMSHQLTYELEGDRLHVYGKVNTQCGPNNYAYFIKESSDDPTVEKLRFRIEEVEPLSDCLGLHDTDFYVPGFDPNLNYIVVDNQGVEHPVIKKTAQDEYRPFIEDGKVWTVREYTDYPPFDQFIVNYYFDGDTIVDGKTCKRMMYVINANEENWVDGVFTPGNLPKYYCGAYYEQDKKVYYANNGYQQLRLLYDFTLSTDDIVDFSYPLVVNKVSGSIPGFKGTYYEFWYDDQLMNRWFEGVGSESLPYLEYPWAYVGGGGTLLTCRVGDEVIYYNSEVEDPFIMNAKKRFDFTHTTKLQPKAPMMRDAESSLYGEYNEQQLDINLDPLEEAYQVRITDASGNVVYEKAINAGNIVGLNIDISNYPKGLYIVTVENSQEAFTGEFEAQATGIEEVRCNKEDVRSDIFNLQGQRISSLQKGLNIVNGQKVFVK